MNQKIDETTGKIKFITRYQDCIYIDSDDKFHLLLFGI